MVNKLFLSQHKRTERIICEKQQTFPVCGMLEKSINWKNTLRHYCVFCCCLIYLAPVFIRAGGKKCIANNSSNEN